MCKRVVYACEFAWRSVCSVETLGTRSREVVTPPACHRDDIPEDDPIGMSQGNLFILDTFLKSLRRSQNVLT